MADARTLWHGRLTLENIDEVARSLAEVLVGKVFTTVMCNGNFGFRPMVSAYMRLGSRGVWVERSGPDTASLIVKYAVDGFWRCSTMTPNDQSGMNDRTPTLLIDTDRVSVEYLAPNGGKIFYNMVVNGPILEGNV